ncbi:SDR family NAD(P)-dependent oxidoreductase [Paenibacillus larvae]|nr:SDR family NAD(P)-dependent oxidoreductase [Paenibacillus larvae]MDT2256303.1 SDR family NAD(P)-dependent oxidoreductase [Paenibacillus larvae]
MSRSGPYAASKFALEGFAESLRHEASPLGIDIILIEPGPFQTGIWEKSISSAQDRIAHSCLKKETARLEKEIRKSAASAGNPMDVIEILLQSLRAKHPKLRYTAGKGIRPTLAAKAFFPGGALLKKSSKGCCLKIKPFHFVKMPVIFLIKSCPMHKYGSNLSTNKKGISTYGF